MRASSALILSVLLVALAPACGSSAPCVSGAQVECACPDGSKGAQACKADGSGFSACLCAGSTTTTTTSAGTGGSGGRDTGAGGSGGATTTTSAGTGGSGGTFCLPGDQIACYSGPANTAGIGLCIAGLTTCKPDGSAYGPCIGEVVPKAETCATPGDDDCDGMTNEGGAGCSCVPNMQSACYSGTPSTEDVGPCHGGMQLCKPDGTGFGPCVGEVTPLPETCNTPVDDDCDGKVNEEGLGCVCTPSATTPCYEGPMGTQNIGICKPGTHICNDQGTALGPCVNQVLPATDLCATQADEDCNGQAMPCVNNQPWSKGFGGLNNQSVYDLAVDASSNVIVGGTFVGTTDFGGGAFVSTAGGNDAWIAKYDAAGNHLWSKKFGDQTLQLINGVAIDPNGNALLLGTMEGSADFGGGALFSLGGNDVFVAKLSPAGNHLWSKSFGGPAGQSAVAVATDASGNMIFTGTGGGTFDFGLGNIPGTGEIFVVKLDAAGNTLWAKRFGVPGKGQIAWTVKTDALGNIVIGGQFDGSLDFGGGALVSMGGEDIFVAKLSPGGDHLWSKSFGSVLSSQRCASVAIDAAGNIVLTGQFLGTINFGGAALVATNMNSTQNIFLAKLDAGGNHLWSKGFGDAAQQYGQAVAFGAGGSILVTGGAEGSTDFGGGALGSVGSRDIFVARFDANGNHVKSQLVGSPGDESGQAIAPDGVGGLFVTGSFSGTINFGNGNLNSAGGYDIFLARLAP